jgi:DNA polymerase-1
MTATVPHPVSSNSRQDTSSEHTGTEQGRDTVMLVDGYGLIFRAYHALPASLTTSAGEQVNAVFGFASMLLDVFRSQNPSYAVVALESGRTFRHEAFADYKANRAEMPDDLRRQIERVHEVITALNVPIVMRDMYEADDVIGSLAHHCAADGDLDVLIVTGDSDLLQLVNDRVRVILPGTRRFGDFRTFDVAAVNDRYGFEPPLVADYKALVGDTSDNIPGVPGIGDKTAKTLIQTYGPLEHILDHLDEIKPPRAQNALAENRQRALDSKKLATIVTDLDVRWDATESSLGSYDRGAVVSLFRELEFRSLLNRLPPVDGPTVQDEGRDRPEPKRQTITDVEALRSLASRIRESGTYAVDVETTSTDPQQAALVGIAIAVSPDESAYIPVGHQETDCLALDVIRGELDPVFADSAIDVYTHHGKYDLAVLQRHGFTVHGIAFDTMIAAYLLGESSIRLKDLAFRRLGYEMTEISRLIGTGRAQLTMDCVAVEDAAPYACGDVEATYALVTPLRMAVEECGQTSLLNEIELPLVPVLMNMETAGIAIDRPFLQDLSDEITARLQTIEQRIHEIAGEPLNIGSNRQVATLLFEKLGLRTGRRTKTGYSVDSDVLESIRAEHPIIELLLEHRTYAKLKSTYVDALPQQVNPQTGRVHTSFNQTVAATGRLSSTNPNLQNIPIRTEIGRRVRHAFIADPSPEVRLVDDPMLLSADYSQIELRLVAHLSEEPFLIDAFRKGEDIHRATAAIVAGVELDEVTPDMRRIAKTVNFGVMYGMQAYGLSRDSGLSRAEAQRFIDDYWKRLPRVRAFFDEVLAFGLAHGYVVTERGRRRYIPQLLSANGAQRLAGERMAINMPVQGSAADIMKIAMIRLVAELTKRKSRARMILQVHDELVLEVTREDVTPVATLVTEVMSNAASLRVPLVVDVASGTHWDEMTPISADA